MMPGFTSLNLATARQIIFAAETKAYQLATPCTISVIDLEGHLIAHVSMDGAPPSRANDSPRKALNALAVGLCMALYVESALFDRRKTINYEFDDQKKRFGYLFARDPLLR